MRRAVPLLLAASIVGSAPSAVSGQDYYADVRPILAENCAGCHTEAGIGWSMEDPERTFERRLRIASAVLERRMPPWLAARGHEAYVGDISLDPAVVAVVERWADAGFPKGDPRPDPVAFAASPDVAMAGHSGFQPDLSLDVLPAGPYLPDQTSRDEYRCFVVDWEADAVSYVTGFRAVPGNLDVAHHVVIYAVEPGMADRFRELEDGEEGAGYRCFGGALPDRLGSRSERAEYEARYPDGVRELDRSNWWLAHWAPGMDGHVFPEGTGIRMEPGAAVVVQMHYYTADAPGQADADTRLDFMVASDVERPAFHLAQTWGPWLGGRQNEAMVIEPGQIPTYRVTDNLGDLVGYIGSLTRVDPERIEALEVHSANLHMHAFGHSGEIYLTDPNGKKDVLLSVPRWDLRWQRDFTFTDAKVFSRKALERTTLTVECTFENPTDETVYGGYGSMDEMCFNFSYIAVRKGAAATETTGSTR